MLEPFSLLPLALAGQKGRVDAYDAQQLVAAGLTLLQRSAPLVRALQGKRSAILLPASPAFLVALAASEGRGAVLIDPLASRYEIAHQLRDADVGAVFTIAAFAPRVPPGVPIVLLDDLPRSARLLPEGITADGGAAAAAGRDVDLGSHVGLRLEGDPDVPGSDDDVAIVYTSAMAGIPLGARLSHRNVLANARSTARATGVTSDDRVLAPLPFSHLFGLTGSAVAPLLSGATVLTMPDFSARRTAELLASGAVTMLVGVPTVYRAVLAAIERRAEHAAGPASIARASIAPALRLCVCGGAPLEIALQDRWAEITGVELRQGYGLTEAGPVCLFNSIDRPNARGALGLPLPGVDVAVVDGEILVRGENVFRGYVSGAEHGLVVRDGWLHTGDGGVMGPDGTVAFTGVLKPMFTHNGFNIYPRELERAVEALPGVTAARVFAIEGDGPEPRIAVEVRGAVSEAAVRHWCAERLAGYKQPAVITVL
jgi:long-chain acyl-CoA synthetase